VQVLFAAELAAAADAVLVAHHLPQFCAYLIITLAHLHVHSPPGRSSLEAGTTRNKKGWEVEGELKRKKRRVAV
jgi:hypothetical protein